MNSVKTKLIIDLVQKNPMLYNVHGTESNAKKNMVWAEIGARLGMDWKYVKKKWKSIKDTYVRAKRRPVNSQRPYYLLDRLKFLDPFILTNRNDEYPSIFSTSPVPDIHNFVFLEDDEMNTVETVLQEGDDEFDNPGHSEHKISPIKAGSVSVRSNSVYDDGSILCNDFSETSVQSNNLTASRDLSTSSIVQDESYFFGMSICSLFRRMSDRSRGEAFGRIFQICQEYLDK